ncbi:MAG: DNA-directed RNA polymerase subunit beta, partial [Candidatus Kerfeldbacteria bacterium]|nr:DNA-directed RNA polymerase subunit beta [Candidatus Kerfeldbacteria bacterium]
MSKKIARAKTRSGSFSVDRVYFNDTKEALPLQNLIEVQRRSYDWLLQEGLRELFEEISPIHDFTGRDLELYFEDYYLDEPRFDEWTARDKNLTYEAPLRVVTKLVNKRTGEMKEQEVFLGDFPLMSPRGTFIVNGIERVVVSQLIRSAGVFFTSRVVKGRKFYGAKIIPNRGAWLEIETETSGAVYVKIDRKRKVATTALLRAFGYASNEEITKLFEGVDTGDTTFITQTL